MNSARSLLRLEIARKLERLPKSADMRLHIKMLQPERRERLRARVDWVEDYQTHQHKLDDALVAAVKTSQARKQQILQPLRGQHGR